jgi:D-inositol-3-phosphate glycosyltransferase
VIATCENELSELEGMDGDVRRVAVVPCGVDLDLFSPEGSAGPPRNDMHRVVTVSRLVSHKGVEDVIRALPDLPFVELVVAGGPSWPDVCENGEARRLATMASRLGVADRVQLLGGIYHDQIPALLRSADVAACASWYEPFGMAALEAMACGIPVVVTAVGGMAETVINEQTGIHVTPRRPDLIAAALRQLLADPELRRRLGNAGAHRARRRYGWRQIARSTLGLCETVAEAHSSNSSRAGIHPCHET